MGRFFLKAAALSVIISIVYNAISGSILWRFRFIYLGNFSYPREGPADTMTTQTLFFCQLPQQFYNSRATGIISIASGFTLKSHRACRNNVETIIHLLYYLKALSKKDRKILGIKKEDRPCESALTWAAQRLR